MKTRPIYQIANEIANDWKDKVYFGARPYLSAMSCLTDITDNYGCDSAESIIRYFLSNATTWRGETARRIKLELLTLLKPTNPKQDAEDYLNKCRRTKTSRFIGKYSR